MVKELKIDSLRVFSDSQLIVGQVKGKFEVRDPTMAKYLLKAKDLVARFGYFEISHIPRSENVRADVLSRLATSAYDALGRTFVESLERPSIDRPKEVLQLAAKPSWMDPIVQYLTDGTSPEDPVEAKRLQWSASQYVMMDGRLYKRSFSLPLLRCLGPTDADYALREFQNFGVRNLDPSTVGRCSPGVQAPAPRLGPNVPLGINGPIADDALDA
ncbi:uncharacterized protein [Elaeis guineensis]|uniref:uncharacterized protein n=1 Tax=Elaeis guineensis var. tenera TaxID=51953 RepID=UPI003C6D9C2C